MSAPQAQQRALALVDELREMGSDAARAGMARFGINVGRAFGVSVPALRALARRVGRDHALAQALWATGHHEARLLACFVDDPGAVTEAQAEAWARDFDSWDLCDQATTSLFIRAPPAWALPARWARRDEPWVRRAAFAMIAGLAVHDRRADDRAFIELLPLIEQAAADERPFVRKGVSWALRNIGKRNEALRAAALACARAMRAEADARAGGPRGGDAGVRSARWVAGEAIRELEAVARQRP
ncbi:MAG TPA: DNA alkylation repair protein [Burkholderiaceae bacterium]